jgi:pimeloyl-ACP methyl ester carboxylesterase
LKANHPKLTQGDAVREYVRSQDGTRIGFRRFGAGPAVVFVHGSISRGADWLGVVNSLARSFTCFTMDRRGYGLSEAGTSIYSIEREYEDIVAVLRAAGRDASLVGHSFGAICALGAALRTAVHRLVLYEPPLPIGGLVAGEDLAPFRCAVADGRLDDALEMGLKKFVRLPVDHVHRMRASSGWPRLVALISPWPRELQAIDDLAQDAQAYIGITCPTLLLLGTESSAHPFRHAVGALHGALPNVRHATLHGQGHMAMRTAQELLSEQIAQFVSG